MDESQTALASMLLKRSVPWSEIAHPPQALAQRLQARHREGRQARPSATSEDGSGPLETWRWAGGMMRGPKERGTNRSMEDLRNPITYTTTPWDTHGSPTDDPARRDATEDRSREIGWFPWCPPGRQPNPADVVRLVCTCDSQCVRAGMVLTVAPWPQDGMEAPAHRTSESRARHKANSLYRHGRTLTSVPFCLRDLQLACFKGLFGPGSARWHPGKGSSMCGSSLPMPCTRVPTPDIFGGWVSMDQVHARPLGLE